MDSSSARKHSWTPQRRGRMGGHREHPLVAGPNRDAAFSALVHRVAAEDDDRSSLDRASDRVVGIKRPNRGGTTAVLSRTMAASNGGRRSRCYCTRRHVPACRRRHPLSRLNASVAATPCRRLRTFPSVGSSHVASGYAGRQRRTTATFRRLRKTTKPAAWCFRQTSNARSRQATHERIACDGRTAAC